MTRFHAIAVVALSAFWASGDPAPPRVLNIVAHPDDDLLFMSPDLFDDRGAVLTVYLSAGDSGRGASYWRRRQRGAMAAHARMAGLPNAWTASGSGIWTLDADPDVRLWFFRLPDGFRGCGSCRYDQESLQKLWQGDVDAIRSVDGETTWSRPELVSALQALIDQHQPSLIRIQDPQAEFGSGDHSDHLATARFALEAASHYGRAEVRAYVGYPVTDSPDNVPMADLRRKKHVFSAYAALDHQVCQTAEDCLRECELGRLCYPAFLARQYRVTLDPERQPGRMPLSCKPCPSSADGADRR